MKDPVFLAASLGKPVANGRLTLEAAQAAIAAATARGMREGTLESRGTLDELLHVYNHILALNVQKHQSARETTTGAIGCILRPLIGTHQPWSALLAEAHNANGDAGFPLTEAEVLDVVRTQVWHSLPTAQRKPHG